MATQLQRQVRFLLRSCRAIDELDTDEGVRVATAARVMFHDTGMSTSLMTHLNLWDALTIPTNTLPWIGEGHSIGMFSLVSIAVTTRAGRWSPHAYRSTSEANGDWPTRDLAPRTWWTEDIGWDQMGRRFSRQSLVLSMSNKDGGAHVDAKLPDDYFDLTRSNGMGWVLHPEGEHPSVSGVPFEDPTPWLVRQIGHEILSALAPWRFQLGLEQFEVPRPFDDEVWPTPPANPLWEGKHIVASCSIEVDADGQRLEPGHVSNQQPSG